MFTARGWFRFLSGSRQAAARRRPGCRPRVEVLEDRTLLSPPGPGWQTIFEDNFVGTALNPSVWSVASGARRDAVNTPSAVSVANGYLTITTYTAGGTNYTGFVGTYNGFLSTYGYWEARINFQDAPGMWSAFWVQSPTIGNPIGDPGTAGTEIDVAEHRVVDGSGADVSNKANHALHWDGYGQYAKSAGALTTNPGPVPLQGNFHTYGLLWSPAGYRFYIDGALAWTTSQAVSNRSEFIYLTSEVQNNSWAGQIPSGGYGSLATSTTMMTVDWVRVWQPVGAGTFQNGGFEDDATGYDWNRYGGAQVVGSGQRSGNEAMRISGYGGAEQVVSGLTPNTTYTLSGWARVTVAGTPALIGVKNYGGPQQSVTITNTAYTQGSVTFTTGPTDTQATVFVYKPTTSNDGYFDDLSLLQVSPLTVLDAGFETPYVAGGYSYDPATAGWTFSGSAGITGNANDFTGGNPPAPEGHQVAFLQGYGGISQAVTFAAGTYTLSFLAAQRGNYQFSSQTFQVLVDGNAVGTFSPADTSYSAFTTDSFTVTAGAHTIGFVGLDPDGQDNTAFLDQVRINAAGVSDPGFELPNVGTGSAAYQYNPSGSPWTFDSGSGVAGNGSDFTGGNPNAPQGSQVAFLQGYGSISQAVTFLAGTYTLSFLAAQRGNWQASSQTFQVLVDGNAVGTFSPADTSYSAFTTSSFTLAAGTHTIKFVGLDPDGQDNTVFLDQLAVNLAP